MLIKYPVVLLGLALMVMGPLFATEVKKDERVWTSLQADNIHDPTAPGLELLQQPEEALRGLPGDFPNIGNQVDWVRALNAGTIQPIDNLYEETQVRRLDLDIIMPNTGEMPRVRFPHKAHTDWLDCSNCHDTLFKQQAGANATNMFSILAGEFCGRCHGAVSFPLTECRRCHSIPPSQEVSPGAQPLPSREYPPVMEQLSVHLTE
jgi:c(7)-type cytochrome triheme protein